MEKNEVKEKEGTFRKRLLSFHKFLTYFYEEQKQSHWQSLIGPGYVDSNDLSFIHLWYILIFSFIPVCSLLATSGLIQPYLASDSLEWGCKKESCYIFIVLFVTYRIGFAVSVFFLFTALVLLSTSKDGRRVTSSALHTGFWVEKIIIVLLLSCVAFSFPHRLFDVIWHYILVGGDILTSCLQLFLICDVVKYFEQMTRAYIKKSKSNTFRACALIFIQVALPLSFIFVAYTLSLYHVSKLEKECIPTIILILINLILVMSLMIYVIVSMHRHILCTLYVVSFDLLIVLKTSEFALRYCPFEGENDPNLSYSCSVTSIISTLLLYIVIIYALVRKFRVTDFYYFHWTISRENDTCAPLTHTKNVDGKSNRLTLKDKKVNPNETLLDFSFEQTSGSDEKNKKRTEMITRVKKEISRYYTIYYSESFIHAIFFLVSLKATVTVTDYQVLGEKYLRRSVNYPLASLIALHFSSIIIVLLYTCYIHVLYSQNHGSPYSVDNIFRTMIHGVWKVLYNIFIKIPDFLGRASGVRYVYLAVFTFVFILVCLMLSPVFHHYFKHKLLFCSHNQVFMLCMFQHPMFIWLYRILASMATFFITLFVLLINVTTRNNRRDAIQNGCWLLKVLLFGALYLCFMKLPNKISKFWIYIGLLSTFWYTMVQLFCLLDAMNIVNKSWNHQKSSRGIYVSSTSFATLLYVLSMAGFVCFYIYFTQNSACKVNRMFASINLVLCLASSIISIHPDVPTGGLLRSGVVTSFCMYLTWSALNYDPNEKCNPMVESWLSIEFEGGGNIAPAVDIFCLHTCLLYFTFRINNISQNLQQLIPFFLFRCKRRCNEEIKNPIENTSSGTDINAIETMNERFEGRDIKYIEHWLASCRNITAEIPEQREMLLHERLLFGSPTDQNYDSLYDRYYSLSDSSEKEIPIPYCYSCLHFVLFLATSYLFILLTNWIEPLPGSDFRISLQWALMSVKMFASSTCVLSYIWLLIEPVLENLYR